MKILRQAFYGSRDEIWRGLMQQMATETGGHVVQSIFGSGGEADKIQIKHGEWTVTVDLYTEETALDVVETLLVNHFHQGQLYTRIRAPYITGDGFRFTICAKSALSGAAKWFGMQDIEVGDPGFDSQFVIQSNNVDKVRQLFSDAKIRELLQKMPVVTMMVRDDEGYFTMPEFPPDTDELCVMAPDYPTTVEPLKRLGDLFAETLDGLCRIGTAYETPPTISL